jgi:hypothetical protein
MLALALIAIGSGASAAALLLLRRRRSRRTLLGIEPRITPAPAGLQHLARTMSDLSDLGIHLRAGQRSAAGKPRLGSLLGLR